MALQLRELAALPGDPGLVPTTHMAAQVSIVTGIWVPVPSASPHSMRTVHTHVCRHTYA